MPNAVSVLSDATIRRLVDEGRIRIDPWDPAMVQPASVDLRLGSSFRVFHNHHITSIDLREPPPQLTEEVEIGKSGTFVIHPGEFCLGATREWVELPDDIVARIEGKALALDTELPTPTGWTTMGDVRVGDRVFDPSGRPARVVAATEPMHERICRRVVFSDGTAVVADLDHLWEVRTKYDRRVGKTRLLSTRQIEQGPRLPNGEYAFHVDEALPVQYPERELPLDPYVLGIWLGDGTSATAEVTTADPEILAELAISGATPRPASTRLAYRIGAAPRTRDPRTGRYEPSESVHTTLRTMGVLGNKHIPREYLEASADQRMCLLHGLMDSDGYVDTLGRCDITTIHRHLAEQYAELVASLGFRPVIATKAATLYGRVCGLRHEVQFTPHEVVFRLPRKAMRQKLTQRFHFGRAIVDVRPVPSVPVRCIEVDSLEGTFLVTRSFIATHNSSLGRLGLIVHATAGFCDPGWRGALTLELNNLMRVPIELSPGLPIAQLSFMTLDRPAERPYGHEALGSHYQGQTRATQSRYGEDRRH